MHTMCKAIVIIKTMVTTKFFFFKTSSYVFPLVKDSPSYYLEEDNDLGAYVA